MRNVRCKFMETRAPTWQLKADRCQYCDVGELIFSRCPSCGIVILICAECGTAYELQERRRGREVGDTSGATRCHACGKTYQHEFPAATAEQVQSLGLSTEDYR